MYVMPVTGMQESGVDRIVEDKGAKVTSKETRKEENIRPQPKKIIREEESKDTESKISFQERNKIDREKLEKVMEQLRSNLPNAEAKYDIHEGTDRIMIKLVDKETNEVIKEIPDEKLLDIIAKCQQVSGVLLDHSV